jgi:hypothetical protein
MLGLAHHSPAIVTVLLTRALFRQHTINVESDKWREALQAYLDQPDDGRIKVLFLDSVSTLSTVGSSNFDLSKVKAIVFDGPDRLFLVKDLQIVDAQIADGSVWKIHNLLPEMLNAAVGATGFGIEHTLLRPVIKVPVEEAESSAMKVKATDDEGELPTEEPTITTSTPVPIEITGLEGRLIKLVVKVKEDKSDFIKAVVDYGCGLIKVRQFNSITKAGIEKGLDEKELTSLRTDLESTYGEKVYAAYYAVAKYNMSAKEAAEKVQLPVEDLEACIKIVPPSKDLPFGFGPPKLITKPKA